MKLIFVVVVVCTFVQSFFSNINGNRVNETELFNTSFIDSDFEKELVAMQRTTAKTISNAFVDCYRNTEIPVKEAVDLFHNPRWGEVREEPVEVKCLVDCVMRKTHLMTDQGLDVERYMVFVKQLRHNYTTFDINSKSGVAKDKIMNTIAKRALLLKNYDRIVFESNHYASCKLKSPRLNLCHELIESYALAARKCKDVKDPKGDACATSFEVMRCIMKENRSRTFNSPFLPDVSPRQIFG